MPMYKLPEFREFIKKQTFPEPGPVADTICGRKTAYLDKVKVVEEKGRHPGLRLCNL